MQSGVGVDHWGTWSILWGEHSFCEGGGGVGCLEVCFFPRGTPLMLVG